VSWPPGTPGVLELPSGRRIRGRGLGRPLPAGVLPEFAVYLLGHQPDPADWPARWVVWPDFRLPKDKTDAAEAFAEALRRSETERVEVACHGGRGRTGTALACIAVLDGIPAGEAVAFVRQHYHRHAVETRGQRRFVEQFSGH
jgi:protein-tyrosine phosphatase